MKKSTIYKLQAKYISVVILSMFLSYLILIILKDMFYPILIDSGYEPVLWRFLELPIRVSTYIPLSKLRFVSYILWFLIFILILFLFTHKKVKHFIQITNAIDLVAKEKSNEKLTIEAKNTLGETAKNMNIIIERLNNSVDERIAEQSKNELITNVSHDLRTPLTSIIGYLGVIEEDRYRDEVQLRYYVNIAYEKSKRLNLLINDLFELTRMGNGGVKISKNPINIVELLNQLIIQFRFQLESANMEERLFFSEDRLIVLGDGDKLVRAFENLISNGITYGKHSKYIDIVTNKEDNTAVIKVINYGDPIPVLDLPHIFERFYRVEKSRSEETGGSGLGLAITKNIVQLHNGEITAYSDEEKTTFEVKLPLLDLTD
ncbi:his Kinase A domain protein [Clostridium argentinense CDC 2741]|uniref:histidine kinase n=1 Tax=Clostridium argentinense CDC 2741 TaxID=1418104 RepID=A0A0C1R1T3_9CLOT|nr:ATP-binding protein [Clostridium argentinense]KIE44401.1 his Kinase A domain protein [Clostridium argentinense CDC 2741]